jgi:hypothetical protein
MPHSNEKRRDIILNLERRQDQQTKLEWLEDCCKSILRLPFAEPMTLHGRLFGQGGLALGKMIPTRAISHVEAFGIDIIAA